MGNNMFNGKRKHIVITQFDAYQDGTLSPSQKKRFEEHLAVCEECKEWFTETNQLIESLAQARPAQQRLPSATAARIERELKKRHRNNRTRDTLIGGVRSTVAWAMLTALIAVVVWQLPSLLDSPSEDPHTVEDGGESQEIIDAGLIEAVQTGDSAGVERSLAAGADPNTVEGDDFFFNPILRTAVMNEDLDAVIQLLQNGADVNGVDSKEDEILWRAVSTGNVELVQLLLEAGANVNTSNHQGDSTLGIAVDQQEADMVDLLLEAGADPNARLEANLNFRTGAVDSAQYTALSIAAFHGELGIMQALADAGADVNLRAIPIEEISETRPLYMPLHVAAQENQLEIIEFLLDNGADIEALSLHGSPLATAATFGAVEAVQLLIDLGADFNIDVDSELSGSWTNLSDQTIDEIRQIFDEARRLNGE